MLLLWFAGGGLVGGLVAGALFGRRRWAVAAPLLGGVVAFAAWVIYVYTAGCPEQAYECYPSLGVIFGLFALAGWAGGVLAGASVRGTSGR